MTVAVAARSAWIQTRISADAASLLLLGGGAAAFVALTWGTWGDLGADTGYDLVAGARLAAGELPYRDFTYYSGPLAPAVAAAAAVVGGAGLAPAVVLGLALAGAVVAATYALGRQQAGSFGGLLAAAIAVPVAFGPTNFSFVLPHTLSAPLAILGALCFVLALGRYAERRGAAWLGAAGVCAGLVALTRPEFAVAVGAAGLAWLCLRARVRSISRNDLALFVAPTLLIPAAVYGALMAVVPPRRLFLENLYPVDTVALGAGTVLRGQAPLTAASFGELGLRAALYAAGAAFLVVLAHGIRRRRSLLMLAAAAGFLLVLASLRNPEALRHGLQFVYGWIPAGAVCAVAIHLRRSRRKAGRWTPAAQAGLAGSVVLAVLAAKWYGAFFIHTPAPQPAVYALPLAAVFLARLHLVELRAARALGATWLAFVAAAGAGLALKDARAESAVVRGPGGALAERPADAAVFQAALSWIERETERDEPILLAPQLTSLYVLAERENPLPEISLLPGALPTARQERAAVRRLEAAGVRLAITDRHLFTEYGHTRFGGSFDRLVADWIRRHFTHAATLRPRGAGAHTLDVWLRRGR